jgi:hypothetical protein
MADLYRVTLAAIREFPLLSDIIPARESGGSVLRAMSGKRLSIPGQEGADVLIVPGE